MRNLKQVYNAQIIEVCEGDGTQECPYTIARYVLVDSELIGEVIKFKDAN